MLRRVRTLARTLLPLALAGCQPEPAWTADSLPAAAPAPASCVPEPPQPGRCARRCGTYVTAFEQVQGDCGARPEQTAQLAGDPSSAPAPCSGQFAVSEDLCQAQFDIRCPSKDASGTTLASVERGSLRWSTDATSAEGSLELWLLDASNQPRCKSDYIVSIARR